MRIGLTFDVRSEPSDDEDGSPLLSQFGGHLDDAEEEFDSPKTIHGIADALRSLGHQVELLGNGKELLQNLLTNPKPDLVFNIAEGRGASRSREARVPAVLEMLGIPYTGSDPLTLAVTLDKDCAKRIVRSHGIKTPNWKLIEPGNNATAEDWSAFEYPLIVKPAFEGSSKGVLNKSVVHNEQELTEQLAYCSQHYRQPILVEEFIDGEELTVGMVGNVGPAINPRVVGVLRIVPKNTAGPFVYSLEVKRDYLNCVEYESPPKLPPDVIQNVERAALDCWKALGCRDLSRFDFRLRGTTPYFLEVNPLPGLNPVTSDLVIVARFMGIEYVELIRLILSAAQKRCGLS